MEHLNYCRQLVKQLAGLLKIPSLSAGVRTRALQLLDLSAMSQKFLLPDGGLIIDDRELRGLGGELPLRLPHQFVALEFRPLGADGTASTSKSILFCREHVDTDSLCITPVFFYRSNGHWVSHDEALVPIHCYLEHGSATPDGKPGINFAFSGDLGQTVYAQIVSVVLGFLNALSCANVDVERSPARKPAKKARDALPFDDYHLLVIGSERPPVSAGSGVGGSHRSPREHIRRGHIRRLDGGRRIWVNAAIVAAGRGGGVVTKDYAVRCAEAAA